jgi:hypothetical protein
MSSRQTPMASPLEFPRIPENVVRRNTSQFQTNKSQQLISILGKRKYQDAMGYENEDPAIQQQKLDIKYEKIPNFSKELFQTAEGLQQIADWFSGYNEYLLSNYSMQMFSDEP